MKPSVPRAIITHKNTTALLKSSGIYTKYLQHTQWCYSAQYLCNLDKMRRKKHLFSSIHQATTPLSNRILSTVWPGTVSWVMSAIPKGQVYALKWSHIYKHCGQSSTSDTLDSESACCNVCRLGVGGLNHVCPGVDCASASAEVTVYKPSWIE